MQFEADAWLFLAVTCGGAIGAAVASQPFWKGALAVISGTLVNMVIAYFSPNAIWLQAVVLILVSITVGAMLRLRWNHMVLVLMFSIAGAVVGTFAVTAAMPGVTF